MTFDLFLDAIYEGNLIDASRLHKETLMSDEQSLARMILAYSKCNYQEVLKIHKEIPNLSPSRTLTMYYFLFLSAIELDQTEFALEIQEFFAITQQEYPDIISPDGKIQEIILSSVAAWKLGDVDTAFSILKQGLEIKDAHSYYYCRLSLFLSRYCGVQGDIEEGIRYGKLAEEYAPKENLQLSMEATSWLATWNFLSWKLDEAFDQFTSIYYSRNSIYNFDVVIGSTTYLGSIYNLRNDQIKSIELLSEAIEIATREDASAFLALAYLYMGITLRAQGQYQDSKHYLETGIALRQSRLMQDQQNQLAIANMYFHLILTLFEEKAVNEMKNVCDELEALAEQSSNILVDIIHTVSHAIYLRVKGRLGNFARAIELLDTVRKQAAFTRSKFISIFALVNLFDLLLFEYRVSPSDETLHIIDEVLLELKVTVSSQNVSLLEVNVLLLTAKYKFLVNKINETLQLLEQISKVLSNKQSESDNQRIKDEVSKIGEEILKLKNLVDQNEVSKITQAKKLQDLQHYLADVAKIVSKLN